ncbi:hypothetical protein BsWGS_23397 [Bradybaena similaris]
MNSATVIFLMVATAIINSECFRTFDKRQFLNSSDDGSSCESRVLACAPTLYTLLFDIGQSFDFGTLAPNIDQMCQDYQIARQCIQPFIDSCGFAHQVHFDVIDYELGFFCSEQGKSLLTEFQQSSCYANVSDINSLIRTCASRNPGDGPVVYDQAINNCITLEDTADCKETAGKIVSALLGLYGVYYDDRDIEDWC